MTRLSLSQQAKAGKEFWSSGLRNRLSDFFLFLVVLFLPTQLGKHFWPSFSFVNGVRIDYLSPTLYLTDILICCFIVSSINFSKLPKQIRKIEKKNLFLSLILVVLLFLGVIFSKDTYVGFYGFIKILEYSLLVLALANNIRKTNFNKILLALGVGIISESALAILQFVNHGSLNGVFYFLGERSFNGLTPNIANASINGALILRPYGTFPHPNVLAGYLLIGMFLLLSKHNYMDKRFVYTTLVLGTICLLLTLSRGPILIWFLVLLFHLIRKRTNLNIKPKFYIFLLLTALLMIFINPFIIERIIGFGLGDNSVLERVVLIKAAVSMIKEHLLLGVGLNNFLINLPSYYSGNFNVFLVQPVHNLILLTLSQVGIFAFAILSYLLIKLYRKTSVSYKTLLGTILILGLFDHYFLTLQQGQILLCLVFGLCIVNIKNNGPSKVLK